MNDHLLVESASTSTSEQESVLRPIKGPLSNGKLLAYGALALPLSLAEIPILLYLPAFYAEELRLSAGVVGAVFLLARLWDGLSDVLVGWLSDRSASRWGRRKPWVLGGVPFLMASTWFLCNPPSRAGVLYLSVWAGLFYTAFTAVKIPHLSWGTELATDYVERSRVTAYRETFTMLGNLLFVSVPLVFLGGDAPLGRVLLLISVSVLLLTPLSAALLAWVKDPLPLKRSYAHPFRGLLPLAKDRAFVALAIATFCYQLSNGISNSLAIFAFDVGLQLPNKLFSIIFILYIATIAALPPTLSLSRRAEKHHLLAFTTILYAAAVAALIWVPMHSYWLVAGLWVVAGFGSAATFFLPTSMLADIIDGAEVTRKERNSGAYVAVFNLAIKLGLAAGVGVAFGLLELVGYVPSASVHNAADAWHIRLLAFGLPALLCVPTIILYLMHPITKKIQRETRRQIDDSTSVRTS